MWVHLKAHERVHSSGKPSCARLVEKLSNCWCTLKSHKSVHKGVTPLSVKPMKNFIHCGSI